MNIELDGLRHINMNSYRSLSRRRMSRRKYVHLLKMYSETKRKQAKRKVLQDAGNRTSVNVGGDNCQSEKVDRTQHDRRNPYNY